MQPLRDSHSRLVATLECDKKQPIGAAIAKRTSPRINFYKNASDQASCPAAAACESEAHVAPGDLVLVGRRFEDFVCASYSGSNDKQAIGWLPVKSLDPLPPLADPRAGDWIGDWKGGGDSARLAKPGDRRANIRIERGERGFLTLEGDVAYVVRPRAPLRSGVLQAGRLKPGPAMLAFVGDDDEKRFEQAEDGECAARIRRVAQFLLLEDNGYCGGMAISFTGVYRRQVSLRHADALKKSAIPLKTADRQW